MSGKTISTSETKIEALKLQSSAYGVTIPVVGGVTRIPGNLIYYADFTAVAHTTEQGGKGGVKTQNTTYAYYASVLMGLCAGQISAVPRIWVGKQLYSDDSGGTGVVTVETATESISVAAGTSANVVHANAFSAHNWLSVTVPTGGGETGGDPWNAYLAEGVDFTVLNGVYTFGANVLTANGTVSYQYAANGSGNGSNALAKLGVTLMPGTLNQPAASWVLSRHANEALQYATLAYISGDAYPLGTGAQVENHNFEVVGPGAYAVDATVPDVDPSVFTINLLTDGRYGARLPSSFFESADEWSDYCIAHGILMSPALTTQMRAADFLQAMANLTNTGIVYSDGRVQMRPYGDSNATLYGVTYTANVTPIYDLSDDVYISDGPEPPVRVVRKNKADAWNHVRVQFQNRDNQYAKEISEAKDQADIETNGLRSASIIQADWICDANVARNVAQLILQRSLYVRATYEFRLPWNFAFLEPMDLVTLTDSSLGLDETAVRITEIVEDGDALRFTAETFALGVANAALYETQVGEGYAQDRNALPGPASICYIFEAPVAPTPATNARLEVMVAAAGNGPNWGGCRVWGSIDGVNYREIGKISGGSRGGTITANMTANQTTANVTLISGTLTSGSAADAANLSTLCYIGGTSPEYVAFETANLTANSSYTLGGLVRGAYLSTANTHLNGDPFVRIDDAIARSGPLDKSMIGTEVHVKLTSFNLFGFAEEDISTVTDYTYTIQGTFATIAPNAVSNLTATGIEHGIRIACTVPESAAYLELWRGTTSNQAASILLAQGLADHYDDIGLSAANGTLYYWVRAVDSYGNAGPYVGPVDAVAGITATPNVVTNLSATGIAQGIHIQCNLPSDPDLAYVQLWRGFTSNLAAAALLDYGLASTYDHVPLTAANGTLYYWVRTVNTVGACSAFVGPVSATAGLTGTPSVVTNLTATGIAQGIHIACVLPTDPDLSYVELWRGTSSNQAASTLRAAGLADAYDDVPLSASNGTLYYWIRTVNSSGACSAFVGPTSATAGRAAAPGNITNFAAAGIPGGIRITCTLPTDPDLAYVELYWGTTSNQAASTLLAQGLADHYDKLGLVPSDGTRYFWARAVNTSGATGNYTSAANATAGYASANMIASVTWNTVTGTGKPSDYADQTANILANSATSILMNSSNLLRSASGNAGVTIGSGGIVARNASNAVTFTLNGSTGAATFAGNITGGSNITISGQANFTGSTISSEGQAAVIANPSYSADYGLIAGSDTSSAAGVLGIGAGGSAAGVAGLTSTSSGTGVAGTALVSGGIGVSAAASSTTQTALYISQGRFQWGSYTWAQPSGNVSRFKREDGSWASIGVVSAGSATATFAPGSKPGSNSSNVWLTVNIGGTLYDLAAWPR